MPQRGRLALDLDPVRPISLRGLTGQLRGALFFVTRGAAVLCAIAAAGFAVYCVLLAYAAATFEPDSLPGPAVLSIVAIGVGLAAILCGGLAHVLWRLGSR